ncbi:hypothetical protein PAAG_01522 [Paracoccidioides lutzii Pb01]|uniref:PAP-associated domain-containing protein n=1 Tax=Paracoccidioides lutzii (strain ATCC MYA-826 / Pb01) TaxID=502779 RepID=C1GSM7_PARBA|nr:hypothetical protein PAAG_01522 [Paracoccidioides lutzii Pb01]EEH39060.2 hypothetical protein PAAG_01522 [Paracoccidioides lutzii Pb01]
MSRTGRSFMSTPGKETDHNYLRFLTARIEEWNLSYNHILRAEKFRCNLIVVSNKAVKGFLKEEIDPNTATGAEVVGHRKTCSGVHIIIHFPSSGGDLAIHSTELLHNYANCDTRVLEMGTFVKHWATARRTNDPSTRTLSSYGYILMILHFLLNVVDPPVLPNLQHTSIGLRELQWIEGCEVFYWRDVPARKKAAHQGKLTRNKQPVVDLLRGFFDYYSAGKFITGRRRFCYKTDVVSVRISGGQMAKNEKGWDVSEGGDHVNPARRRQRYYLAIEDPFRTKLNVAGGVNMRGLSVIKDEFARARNIILITDNEDIGDDLFRPKVSPQNEPNLQHELHDLGLANTR